MRRKNLEFSWIQSQRWCNTWRFCCKTGKLSSTCKTNWCRMAALKLVNNTGLKSEKNLCYVNTELQLLYSTPDVRSFFTSKTYRENFQGRLHVCDELSRLFRTKGQFQTSAAELRRLVGQFHRRDDILNFLLWGGKLPTITFLW